MKKLNLADIVSNEFYEFVDRYVKGKHKKRDKDILKAVVGVLECTPHIVRCKDCKYWQTNTQFCTRWSAPFATQHTSPNWYCADAERKDGDGE